ncbi:hypothetical protein SAMN04487846_3625 [Microbacterium sp. cf046]|uniref:hypothetical protein n=1 Tax=Microbacterium sp. cf046 TaxID=1761803 RepID=UPI0008E41A00|nr:hypothetical protein [Microbacterium sp. cf046]SFS17672.1 hypothetical protein SAMN04487846_3625 [Microbacterium sp. cf046]
MTVIIVEGESDRVAVETLGARSGLRMPEVRAVGGSKGARGARESLPGERLVGLVDRAEQGDFERFLGTVFVCDPDLEGELVRALTPAGVESLIDGQGELEAFRLLQQQPAQRTRSVEQQLSRFFGGRSGNKLRYARIMAEAVPLERMPPPIAALLASL